MRLAIGARAPLVGVLVGSRGVFGVVCRRVRDGIEVIREFASPATLDTSATAAKHLVRVLGEQGLAGANVSITLRGFESAHHILQLPAADDLILRSIVEREIRRLEPSLTEPVVGFSRRDAAAGDDEILNRHGLLAGAVSRNLVQGFEQELAAGGYRLEHITLAPQALQRLYEETDSASSCTAVVLSLPDGPVLAFFLDRTLRLIIEPPAEGEVDVNALAEEADLGGLYLRQQFRGAQLERVLAALDSDEVEGFSVIGSRVGVPVHRFGARTGSAAALLALGAVLDAYGAVPLSLGGRTYGREPAGRKRPKPVQAAMWIAVAVMVWLSIELVALGLGERELRGVRRDLARVAPAYPSMRRVVDRRQSQAQALSALELVRQDAAILQRDLAVVGAVAPGGMRLDSIEYRRDGSVWQASIGGVVRAATNAQAVELLNAYYEELPQRVHARGTAIEQLEYVSPPNAPALRFLITYQVAVGAPEVR